MPTKAGVPKCAQLVMLAVVSINKSYYSLCFKLLHFKEYFKVFRAGGSGTAGTAQAVPLFVESTYIAINIFIATIDINLLSLINACPH